MNMYLNTIYLLASPGFPGSIYKLIFFIKESEGYSKLITLPAELPAFSSFTVVHT